jgi:hypothetical protein
MVTGVVPRLEYKALKEDLLVFYLVPGIALCILSMVFVATSRGDLIWSVLGFGLGIYMIFKGRKKMGYINKK